MRIKTFFLTTLITFSLHVIGQEKTDNLDFRFGAGISLLGSGDMVTFNYENEINYKLNQYFAGSLSINLGRSNNGAYKTASFTQGNINAYFSPLKNNKRFDFRIGTGLTYYGISDAYQQSAYYENGVLVDVNYLFDNRNSFGFNVIIENSYLLSDKFLIGFKLFSQPYFNGDINSGILLKLGFII
jgi:hypothetical protein